MDWSKLEGIIEDVLALMNDFVGERRHVVQELVKYSVFAEKVSKKEKQIWAGACDTVMPDHYSTVWTEHELMDMVAFLDGKDVIAVDTETDGVNPFTANIVGISFYTKHKGYYIPIRHMNDINVNPLAKKAYMEFGNRAKIGKNFVRCLPAEKIIRYVKPLLEDSSKTFLFHNWKFDYHILRCNLGIHVDLGFDTMLGQWVLDENQSKRLKDIAPLYLKVEADTYSALFGKITFDRVPILESRYDRSGSIASYYAIKDTELTYNMWEFQMNHLNHPQLAKIKELLFDIEMPFAKIVAKAEARGVRFDSRYMQDDVSPVLHSEVEKLHATVVKYVGEINLNSPKQLSNALYNQLYLPKLNKKRPESTDKKTLGKLLALGNRYRNKKDEIVADVLNKRVTSKDHQRLHDAIVARHTEKKFADNAELTKWANWWAEMVSVLPATILDYRAQTKLCDAFVDKLPQLTINDRIHCSFKTIGTVTGRLACAEPNLQQMPSKVGGLIRNAFVADEGRLLVSIDFS